MYSCGRYGRKARADAPSNQAPRGHTKRKPVCSLGEDDGDDHAVKAESLSEDENEDHSYEDCFLLRVRSDSSVTDNSNSETCCEGGEAASEARCEVLVSVSVLVEGVAHGN